jgi:hypothetical protein
MMKDDQNQQDIQPEEQSPGQPFDGIENLYIGHIDELAGFINGQDELETPFKGELLLDGQAEGGVFEIKRFRRLALYGRLREPPIGDEEKPDRIGVISLAGPLRDTTLKPNPKGGVDVENLRLQLHYRALSDPEELPPRFRSGDAEFPEVEEIAAKLTLRWEQDGGPDEPEVRLAIELHIDELVTRWLGLVEEITFDPFVRPFRLAGHGLPGFQVSKRNSLHGCPDPGGDCGNDADYNKIPTSLLRLPLKFINVSKKNLDDEQEKIKLKTACQGQIDGVCVVWRNKAALRLDVEPEIDDAKTLKNLYEVVNPEKAKTLPADYAASISAPSPDPYPDHVEVYLVEKLEGFTGSCGGGATYDDGQASAFCILQVNQLNVRKNLLAHELGHVLGVSHPGDEPCPGSRTSIMHPPPPGFEFPTKNTRQNCRVITKFKDIPCCTSSPLNPIVTGTGEKDLFCLDE